MKVSKIFEALAKTKVGQKVYKWCGDGNHDKFLNHNLPQLETILSTSCYVWSTAKQKNIDDDRKNLLQIQNIGSGLVGLVLAGAANRWVYNQGEKIIKDLDPKKLDPKAIRKVSTGLRVGLPLITTAFCMRMLIPTALACFSGQIMSKVRENREKYAQKKLDIKA